MNASSKKFNYLMMLLIIIIFLFVLSDFIYVMYRDSIESVNRNDVILNSDSNTIIIKSLITANDEFGKTIADDNSGYYGYLEFDVKNLVEEKREFQIYAKKSDINLKEIDEDFVKIYLTDLDDSSSFKDKIFSFGELSFLNDIQDNKLLYEGFINGNASHKFKLRVWLSDSYVIKDNDESFSFVIFVRAI